MKAGGAEPKEIKCFKCGGIGHFARVCPSQDDKKKAASEKEHDSGDREEKSHEVGAVTIIESAGDEYIHDHCRCSCIADDCISLACGKKIDIVNAGSCQKLPSAEMPVCNGLIGQQCVKTLRDTGCSGVIVKKKFVRDDLLTGESKLIVRIDNTIVKAPVANIEVDTPYYTGVTEAVCLDDALYDLVIGNIDGARKPHDQALKWKCESLFRTKLLQAG